LRKVDRVERYLPSKQGTQYLIIVISRAGFLVRCSFGAGGNLPYFILKYFEAI
jgi:hypothetical protein